MRLQDQFQEPTVCTIRSMNEANGNDKVIARKVDKEMKEEEDKKRIIWSSSVTKLSEIVNISKDSKCINNKVNTLLFDPGGSVFLK
ncbi:hypothetical protein F8M41_017386 [Gigaspora margarita]|uniref:Uncharacterized protein n=1 Tax=Gigaspora margarita TaxID=4874 RepID=A0A8H4AN82_GIGMA|nr:hypothetical protein F8M41_017386 [Gigaspora margarita]